MNTRLAFAALSTLAMLAACGSEPRNGSLSAEDERRLDNAAAMLDDNLIDASPDSLVANAEELDAAESQETNSR